MTFISKTLPLAALLLTVNAAIGQIGTPVAGPQDSSQEQPSAKVVVVTGARFSYSLVEKWIDEYNKVNPTVQIIVEARGSTDPLAYDILAEVYRQDEQISKNREYLYVGRYAILPVANSISAFSAIYSAKGLNNELIRQIYFEDIFADKAKQTSIKTPFTVYTRLQKAGVPTVFASYFGYDQRDIRGNVIAGADVHLLKALLRDSTGISYLPVPLIYDLQTRKPVEGLTVLPVDLNGNKKVSDDEKFYDDLDKVIEQLEASDVRIKNIPIEYLHLSVDKHNASAEAIDFLQWVNEHGQINLHEFGYLAPDQKDFDRGESHEFSSKRDLN